MTGGERKQFMKKHDQICNILILSVILAVLVTGCGKKAVTSQDGTASEKASGQTEISNGDAAQGASEASSDGAEANVYVDTYEEATDSADADGEDTRLFYSEQKYPVFTGETDRDKKAAENINAFIESILSELKDDNEGYKADAKSLYTASGDMAELFSAGSYYDCEDNFEYIHTSPEYTVVAQESYENLMGAHPNFVNRYYVFDSTTGKKISLDEFLKDYGADSSKVFSAIRTVLDADMRAAYSYNQDYTDTIADTDDLNTWYVEGSYFRWHGNQYDVASYAAGEFDVLIPLDWLSDPDAHIDELKKTNIGEDGTTFDSEAVKSAESVNK